MKDQGKLDAILTRISEVGFPLGKFLHHLFGEFTRDELKLPKDSGVSKRSPTHAKLVSFFLSEETNHPIQSIISVIYKHPGGAPTRHRATAEHEALPNEDPTPMAQHQLKLWTVDTTSKIIESAKILQFAQWPHVRSRL